MRIAAAQIHQAWGRPDAGTERIISVIEAAAAEDVDLLAFGETHLGGYPFWVSMTDGARFDTADQK
jgi:nitrilase